MFDQNDRREREEQKELTKKKTSFSFSFSLILERENDRPGAFCLLKTRDLSILTSNFCFYRFIVLNKKDH
jgi:hypothetical protein